LKRGWSESRCKRANQGASMRIVCRQQYPAPSASPRLAAFFQAALDVAGCHRERRRARARKKKLPVSVRIACS